MAKKEPKGLPKKEHWEIKYNPRIPNTRENQIMGSDFNPLKSKDRYKVYNPVNETDT